MNSNHSNKAATNARIRKIKILLNQVRDKVFYKLLVTN